MTGSTSDKQPYICERLLQNLLKVNVIASVSNECDKLSKTIENIAQCEKKMWIKISMTCEKKTINKMRSVCVLNVCKHISY